jgi:hypothetical protein
MHSNCSGQPRFVRLNALYLRPRDAAPHKFATLP